MTKINEATVARILNETSIDLGEYVINPFMGCAFSCLYCYVRSNRVVSKRGEPWGEYVDVRMNAPELLEKEIVRKKPGTVLLGSTTECFQPAEGQYRITRRILEILNKHKVGYVILTRSPMITEYLPLLTEGNCKMIYFTVNKFSDNFKEVLEPKSPAFELRDAAVQQLCEAGVPVMPYISPLLPWISDINDIYARFPKAGSVEVECLNFRLSNIRGILDSIARVDPAIGTRYEKMLTDKDYYAEIWKCAKESIEKQAKKEKKRYTIYAHNFDGYFNNSYTKNK